MSFCSSVKRKKRAHLRAISRKSEESIMKNLYSVVFLENPVGKPKTPSWQNIFSQLEKNIFSVG